MITRQAMVDPSTSNPVGQITNKEPRARVDYLDGIRGWASVVLLLKHLVINLLALSTPALLFSSERLVNDISDHRYLDLLFGLVLGIATNGHLGLFILFALSGYALSAGHLNIKKNTLAPAAASRYFRLMLPILYTSLFAYVLAKLGLFFNNQATASSHLDATDWLRFAYQFDASLKNLATFAFYDVFFKYDWYASYNVVLWTIQMQFLGSFIVYGFLAIFRRTPATPWAMAIFLALALFNSAPILASFIFGYLIAEFRAKYTPPARREVVEFALIAIFLGACVLATLTPFKGDRASCILACAVILSVSYSESLKAIFSIKLSRFFGRVSFPLYLIQIPVICSWSSYWYMKLPSLGFSNTQSTIINLLTTVAVCIALGAAQLPLDKWSISASKKLGGLLLNQIVRPTAVTTYQAPQSLQRRATDAQ
jgi:peptidoglycan/LPS O-acetylase OafA/YrhL